jgi:glucosamine--fructose-6-phosphate aminotransferase (isomerizing)
VSAGDVLLSEIREQPAALRRLLERQTEIEAAAGVIADRSPRLIRLVAHGSSDNAASYGVYAFGVMASATALRDSISLSVYLEADLDMRDSVVLALSQSGRTQDVVAYVRRARSRGALTVAVTNDPGSDLAEAADVVVPIEAGLERATAATKTYLNQLAVLALLAGALGGSGGTVGAALAEVSNSMETAIGAVESSVSAMAASYAGAGRMFVIGRGQELATAREIALKVTEVSGIAAEPLSATALSHGPLVAVDPLFPVWVVASDDPCLPAVLAAAERAEEAGAALIASGNAARAISHAAHVLPLPAAPLAILSPLLSVLPGQLFARAVSLARGLDPDHPVHLQKVTLAP